jgi:hypothetical protein
MTASASTAPTPTSSALTAKPLRLRRMGIDTYQEPVLYMHRDCPSATRRGSRPSRASSWP